MFFNATRVICTCTRTRVTSNCFNIADSALAGGFSIYLKKVTYSNIAHAEMSRSKVLVTRADIPEAGLKLLRENE